MKKLKRVMVLLEIETTLTSDEIRAWFDHWMGELGVIVQRQVNVIQKPETKPAKKKKAKR